MSFVKTFGWKMSKRCKQYAVRETYKMFQNNDYSYSYKTIAPKKEKVKNPEKAKPWEGYNYAKYDGKVYEIEKTWGDKVRLNGKYVRAEDCIFGRKWQLDYDFEN